MTVVGEATLVLQGDTSDLERKLDGAAHRFRSFGQSMISVGSRLTAGITVPIVGLGAAMVATAVRFDSLNRGLIAVSGSADEANRQFTRLVEVAKLPGLGLEEAIEGSIALQAAGFEAETAERALRAFGNALATVGRGKAELDGVVRALTQIQAKGVVSAEEINQLAERLPQIREAMEAAFGTQSTEAIQKMGLTTSQFIGGLIAEFEKLPQVTTGAQVTFENLTDSLSLLAKQFGDILLPTVLKVTEKLTAAVEWFGNLDANTKETIVTVAALAAVIGPVVLGLGAVAAAVAALATPIGLAVVAVGALTTAFVLWGDDVVRIARQTFDAVAHFFDNVFGGIVDIARRHIEAVSNAFKWLKDQVVGNSHVPDLIDGIRDEFRRLDSVMVQPALAAVAKVNAAFASVKMPNLGGVTAHGNPNPMGFESAFPGIGSTFSKISGALNGLVGGLTAASAGLALFAPIVKGVAEVLKPTIEALLEPLVEVGRVLGGIIKPVLDALKAPLQALAKLITVLLEPFRVFVDLLVAFELPLKILSAVFRVLTIAVSYLQEAIGFVIEALGRFVDSIVPDFISTVGKGLAQAGRDLQERARAVRNGTDAEDDSARAAKEAATEAARLAKSAGQAAGAVREFASATSGVPQGFRVNDLNLARFNATVAETAGSLLARMGGNRITALNGLTAAPAGAVTGGGHNFYQTFEIYQQAGENGEQFANRVAEIMETRAVHKNLTDGKTAQDPWAPR